MEATAVFMTSWAMKFDTEMLHLWYNPHISHTSKRQLSWILMDFAKSGECPTIGETMAEFKGINLYICLVVDLLLWKI